MKNSYNSPKLWFVCFFAVFACYLIIASHAPVSLLVQAKSDDMLFINQGISLAKGEWLGNYNENTLVKGPGYPFFLAMCSWLGVSATFAQAFFLCIVLTGLAYCVYVLSNSYLVAFIITGVLLFDPRLFEVNRFLRDTIYGTQSILFLSSVFYAFLVAKSKELDLLFCVCRFSVWVGVVD